MPINIDHQMKGKRDMKPQMSKADMINEALRDMQEEIAEVKNVKKNSTGFVNFLDSGIAYATFYRNSNIVCEKDGILVDYDGNFFYRNGIEASDEAIIKAFGDDKEETWLRIYHAFIHGYGYDGHGGYVDMWDDGENLAPEFNEPVPNIIKNEEADGVLIVRHIEDMEHDEYSGKTVEVYSPVMSDGVKFDPEPLEVMDEYIAKLTYLEMSGEADGRESEGRILDMMEYVTDDDLQFVADGCNCIVDIGGKYIYPHKDMLVIKRRYYYVCAQAAAVAHAYGNDAWLKATLRAVNEANEGHRIEAHFANDVLEVVCHTETPKGEDKEFTISMNVRSKQIKHSAFVEPRTNVRFNFDLQRFGQPDGVDDGADVKAAIALIAQGMATLVPLSTELMAQIAREYDVFSIANNEEGGVYMNGHDLTMAKLVAQMPIGREEVDLLLTELQQAKHPMTLRHEDRIKTVIVGKHTFRLAYGYVSHRRDHTVVHAILFNASDNKMAAKIHWNLKYEQPVVVCINKKDANGKPYKYYGQHKVAQEAKKTMVPMLTALVEQNWKLSCGRQFVFDWEEEA